MLYKLEAEDHFNQFWKLYPRRVGKRAAQLKFRKACERADISDIMEGLKEAVIRFKTIKPEFIPHPATWLHGDRWLDEEETKEIVIENPHKDLDVFCDMISRSYVKSQQTKGNWSAKEIENGREVVDAWLKGTTLTGMQKVARVKAFISLMHPGTKVTSFAHWQDKLKG